MDIFYSSKLLILQLNMNKEKTRGNVIFNNKTIVIEAVLQPWIITFNENKFGFIWILVYII